IRAPREESGCRLAEGIFPSGFLYTRARVALAVVLRIGGQGLGCVRLGGGACALLADESAEVAQLGAQARLLAPEIAQVVEAGAPHVAARLDLHLRHRRRLGQEDPLDADSVGDLAHGESRGGTAAAAADHDALEYLDPLLVALGDRDVHADGVPR